MEVFEPKTITFRKGEKCGIPVRDGISKNYRDLGGRDSWPFEGLNVSEMPTVRIEVSG